MEAMEGGTMNNVGNYDAYVNGYRNYDTQLRSFCRSAIFSREANSVVLPSFPKVIKACGTEQGSEEYAERAAAEIRQYGFYRR